MRSQIVNWKNRVGKNCLRASAAEVCDFPVEDSAVDIRPELGDNSACAAVYEGDSYATHRQTKTAVVRRIIKVR